MSRYNRYGHTRPPQHTPASVGLQLGDLVTMDNVQDSTGGIIYQIVEDQVPIVPHTTEKKTVRKEREWRDYPNKRTSMWQRKDGVDGEYVEVDKEHVEYGAWDENGKKIMISALSGFVRIKPLFTFYPTYKGKSPKGKGETIIIAYDSLRQLRKVSIADLGAKYIELGEVMKYILRKGGAEDI